MNALVRTWTGRSSATVTRRFYAATPLAAAATSSTGSNPLHIFRQECVSRNLCNGDGTRRAGVHWVLSVAMNAAAERVHTEPPNLRTVGVQRVSEEGIDFCIKKGSTFSAQLGTVNDDGIAGIPVSILHLQGRFVAGETAEQWRGDGVCFALPLDSVLSHMPTVTVTSMVGSKRIEAESAVDVDSHHNRSPLGNKAHTTEVMQKTRRQLENNEIPFEEMDESIQAVRFVPYRLECMTGGPDSIMWDRMEWKRPMEGDGWTSGLWDSPGGLLPH